jgi:hypothetical protein
MFGGLWRWLWGWGAAPADPSYGGKTWRSLPTWARAIRRDPPALKRIVPRANWNRVVKYERYDRMPNAINRQTIQAHASDDRLYLFDLHECPEIRFGDTIASATILGDTTGLTVGAATATTVEIDGIPAGEAVQVTISGWTADETYLLSARVTFASGRKVVVAGKWVVMADY